MNFEDMIQRLIDGLTIIQSHSGDVEVGAHSYLLFVPGDYDDYKGHGDDVASLEDLGWSWSDDFGWVFPTIG